MSAVVKFFRTYPAAISGAIQAGYNLAVTMGWWHVTEPQLAAINTFGAAVLALIVHSSSTPNVKVP